MTESGITQEPQLVPVVDSQKVLIQACQGTDLTSVLDLLDLHGCSVEVQNAIEVNQHFGEALPLTKAAMINLNGSVGMGKGFSQQGGTVVSQSAPSPEKILVSLPSVGFLMDKAELNHALMDMVMDGIIVLSMPSSEFPLLTPDLQPSPFEPGKVESDFVLAFSALLAQLDASDAGATQRQAVIAELRQTADAELAALAEAVDAL